MVYAPHQYMQLSGTLGPTASPYEIWSTGLRTVASTTGGGGGSTPVVLPQAVLEEYLETVVLAQVGELATTAFSVAGAQTRINLAKYNQIDGEGHYFYDQTVQEELPNVPFGGNTQAAIHPTQVSKVLTLETGFTRGVAARGRMYIPNPANAWEPAAGTLQLDQIEVNNWATWIEGFNAEIVDGATTYTIEVAVVSSIGNGFDNFRLVTGVSMDDRADVQRRRANDIVGTRLTSLF